MGFWIPAAGERPASKSNWGKSKTWGKWVSTTVLSVSKEPCVWASQPRNAENWSVQKQLSQALEQKCYLWTQQLSYQSERWLHYIAYCICLLSLGNLINPLHFFLFESVAVFSLSFPCPFFIKVTSNPFLLLSIFFVLISLIVISNYSFFQRPLRTFASETNTDRLQTAFIKVPIMPWMPLEQNPKVLWDQEEKLNQGTAWLDSDLILDLSERWSAAFYLQKVKLSFSNNIFHSYIPEQRKRLSGSKQLTDHSTGMKQTVRRVPVCPFPFLFHFFPDDSLLLKMPSIWKAVQAKPASNKKTHKKGELDCWSCPSTISIQYVWPINLIRQHTHG